jgi:hypothetical protein
MIRSGAARLLALFLPLSACSVATPPRLAASRPFESQLASVRFDPAPEGWSQTALSAQFEGAVRELLAAKGIVIAADAPRRLSAAIVQRPAAVGITAIKPGTSASPDWISQPRRHRWLDACRAQRFEATLVLLDTAQGAQVGQARGAFDDCKASDTKVKQLAGTLVSALFGG